MAKAPNYTDEQITRMLAVYDADDSQEARDEQVKTLATEFSRKSASIIAKLSNLKVYKAKTYKTKNGGETVRKGAIVALIAGAMGETEESFDTLVKANKTVLEAVWNFVKPEEVVADENDSQEEGDTSEVMEEAETA